MNILLYVFVSLFCLVLIMLLIGTVLPDERTETRSIIYAASPREVYNVLTNNSNYSYRSDLQKVIILEKCGDMEIWDEVARNGNIIRFKTVKKVPYSLYEFEIIQASGFTGHWIGELMETETGGTLFTSTEVIRMKNPLLKVASRLFFDIGKFMETYQNDLKKKLEKQALPR